MPTEDPIISNDIFKGVPRQMISISLLEREAPMPLINAVSSPSKLNWMEVPIAVDAISMSSVTPPQTFSCLIQAIDASKNKDKFHGADASPIPNLEYQHMSGRNDSETLANMDVDFEVANITTPLETMSKLVEKKNTMVFDEGQCKSQIQHKSARRLVKIRKEDGLYDLNVWVQVLKDMERSHMLFRNLKHNYQILKTAQW